MINCRILMLNLLFFICIKQVNAQLCFIPADSFAIVGTQSIHIINADFNGDGHVDLVVANQGSGTGTGNLCLLLGNGTGSFGAATNIATVDPAGIVSADFNGDTKPDLAVCGNGSYNMWIYLNTGAGSFTPTSFTVWATPIAVTSNDFNGDGKPDLAISTFSDSVNVMLGTGTGSFVRTTGIKIGAHPFSIINADFNGDGNKDLLTTYLISDSLDVFLGTGTGSFGPVISFTVADHPDRVISEDFNGDGKLDLATVNYHFSNTSILLGTGSGSFGAATNFTVGSGTYPYSIISADFNNDGRFDLATSNEATDDVSVLLGTGTGSFGADIHFSSASKNPEDITAADFNGDGRSDLAVANLISNHVSVLLNCTAFGIANFGNEQEQIIVYPNPANAIINVELNIIDRIQTNLQITDMMGNTVKQSIIYNLQSIIDVTDLSEGVYNISVSTKEGTINKKLVIMH